MALFEAGRLEKPSTNTSRVNQRPKQVRFDEPEPPIKTPNIVKGIQEHTPRSVVFSTKPATQAGFPGTFLVGDEKLTNPNKKVSLFKQAMMKKRGESVSDESPSEISYANKHSTVHPEVEPENVIKIQNMSEKDILSAQEEIKSMFDSKVLDRFINKVSHVESLKPAEVKKDLKDLSWIRTEDQLDEAINMLPSFEKDKLRWTGRVVDPVNEAIVKPDDSSIRSVFANEYRTSASKVRFDFNGNVIPVDALVSRSSGLYHHEEEENAAGYTIADMMTLIQSAVPSQRSIGLGSLEKVLRIRHNCLYANYLPVPVTVTRHALFTLPRELPLLLRVSLDSGNLTVVSSALATLVAFLVPSNFSCDFDSVLHCPQLMMLPCAVAKAQGACDIYGVAVDNAPMKTRDDEEEGKITDVDLIEESPVRGLVHTGLVERIAFLLGSDSTMATGVRLTHDGKQCCWLLLCMIATHSETTMNRIANHKNILSYASTTLASLATLQDTEAIEERKSIIRLFTLLSLGRKDLARIIHDEYMSPNIPLVETWTMKRIWARYSIQSSFLTHQNDYETIGNLTLENLKMIKSSPKPGSFENLIELNHAAFRSPLEETMRSVNRCMFHDFLLSYVQLMLVHDFGMADDYDAIEIQQDFIPSSQSVIASESSPNKSFSSTMLLYIFEFLKTEQVSDTPESLFCLYSSLRICFLLSKWNDSRIRIASAFDHVRMSNRVSEIVASRHKYESSLFSFHDSAVARAHTLLKITMLRMNNRVFGISPTLPQLYSLVPQSANILGDEYLVTQVFKSLLSPAWNLVSLENSNTIFETLEPFLLGIHSSHLRLISDICHESPISYRICFDQDQKDDPRSVPRLIRKKWNESKSAWFLLALQSSEMFEPRSGLLKDILSASILLKDCMASEDVVILLVKFISTVEPGELFEKQISNLLLKLLDCHLCKLMEDSSTFYSRIEKAAGGGKSQVVNLWKDLIIAFNESLFGHPIGVSLLLLMFRMDAGKEVRFILWSDLYGGNLLKLVSPCDAVSCIHKSSDGSNPFSMPPETDPELLQIMCRALCDKVLTRTNNPFLFNIVLDHLANYIWVSSLTWNRKRLLKDLVVCTDSYIDLAKRNINGTSDESFHTRAIAILKIVSREEPAVWQRLEEDNLIDL